MAADSSIEKVTSYQSDSTDYMTVLFDILITIKYNTQILTSL